MFSELTQSSATGFCFMMKKRKYILRSYRFVPENVHLPDIVLEKRDDAAIDPEQDNHRPIAKFRHTVFMQTFLKMARRSWPH